jgi:hypothetical protein
MRRAALVVSIFVRLLVQPAEAATVTLVWDPNTESNLAGYLLSYGTASGQYTTTIDVGNVTTYHFEEPNPSVRYYLALRAYGDEGLISPYSNEVVTTPNPPLTMTVLSSNRMSPQPVGTSIVFTATAEGGSAPYQFKWWIDNAGTSTVGAQWSTSNMFTWTPASPSSTYVIRVWARNAANTADAPDSSAAILTMTFVITGAAVNVAPTVNAGADHTIIMPGTAALSGTVSDDGQPAPPGVVTLAWTRVSGPGTVVFSAPSAASTTATFSASGTYVLRLTASDSVLSTSDDVTVTVNPAANVAPTVSAGADRTITLPGTAALSGTVSDDGLPTPPGVVSLTWTRVSGPGTVVFSAPSAASTTATFGTSGTYVLRLTASDSVLSSSDDVTVTVNPADGGAGTGLRGQYYNDPATGARFSKLALTRTDASVNFSWSGTPAPGVQSDHFSVRWTGQVQVPITGTYTFATTSDDGVRLWVNGQRIINGWNNHSALVNTSAGITLKAGVRYNIRVDFYERTGGAQIQLRWTPPGQAETVIPTTHLFP